MEELIWTIGIVIGLAMLYAGVKLARIQASRPRPGSRVAKLQQRYMPEHKPAKDKKRTGL
jgi:hypothetical protein